MTGVPFDTFANLDLRIGRIEEVEPVMGSKKLLRLRIDVGGGVKKQSVAGLGDAYKPEDLRSKLVAVVTNLEPRTIFGLISEAMVLATMEGQTISILQPEKDVTTGTKIG
jgi:methionine--tRNA ligase beta chain|tara:strand:+ start:272 stop:601 length:330 start_codon:yes stop_codon:yes gene_type:complete